MTNQEQMSLLRAVVNTIFLSKAQGTDISQVVIQHPNLMQWSENPRGYQPSGRQNGRWFKNSVTGQITLRGFDLNINLGTRVVLIRVLEQNPNKNSQYAIKARQGYEIAWVIDRRAQVGGFLGRIEDGQWHESEQRATYPANYQTTNQLTTQNIEPGPHYTTAVPVAQTEEPVRVDDLPELHDDTEIQEFILQNFADSADEEYENVAAELQ